MKRVLTALVLIPLVLLAVFRAPDWLFTLLVGVVAVLATIEYLQIAAKYGYQVYPVVTCLAVGAIFACFGYQYFQNSRAGANDIFGPWVRVTFSLEFVAIVFAIAPSIFLAAAMRSENLKDALPGAAFSYFSLSYIGLALSSMTVLRAMPAGWFFVLFTFLAVWMGDTAAYYVGRSIGKTKFAARISPKKTWEGAIASGVGAMIIGVVFTRYAPHLQSWSSGPSAELNSAPLVLAAIFALLINIAAQLGDLFESLIKRGADVKDSGTMLPGHGGMLDRIDALLFASPVALILFVIYGSRFYLIH